MFYLFIILFDKRQKKCINGFFKFMDVNEIFFVGSNKYGQSGTSEKNCQKHFDTIKSYDFGVFIKQISCGNHHSALLTISGYVYTMGSNIHGTLGSRQQARNYSFSPILVQGLPPINKIESGGFHICALSSEGQVYSWGRGMDGQLGHGTNKSSNIPQKIQMDEEIIDIGCGTNHSIIITANNETYAFGNGIYGQLGTGNNKSQLKPHKINSLKNVVMVAAGQNHSLFLCGDVLYAAGDNTSGQIGVGNNKKYVLDPVRINLTNVSIAKAGKFSCAIASGQLYVWGGPSKQYVPFLVQSQLNFTDVKAGNEMLMVLSSKGELFSWKVDSNLDQDLLKPVVVDSKTILDFSIGQNHMMILGDIVRTVEQEESIEPPPQLKHFERTCDTLKEITSQTCNKKDTKPTGKQNKPIQMSQLKSEESPLKKMTSMVSQSKFDQPITQKTELNTIFTLIRQLKSLSVQTASSNLSGRSYFNKLINDNRDSKGASDKSNIMLLRQKDYKISELQQEISKKDAMIEACIKTIQVLRRKVCGNQLQYS